MKTLLILLVLPVALMALVQILMVVRLQRAKGKPAPHLTGPLGAALEAGGRTLFYFYSPACGPCRRMSPAVERVRGQDARVHPVDVSVTPEVALRFGVMATPSVVVVEDGIIRDVRLGLLDEPALRALLV